MTTCLDQYLDTVKEAGSPRPSFSREKALALMLGYLFGNSTLAEMQDQFEQKFGLDFDRATRKLMVSDPKVMYEMRFPLYQAVHKQLDTPQETEILAIQLGMPVSDIELLAIAQTDKRLVAHFKRLKTAGYKALSIKKFEHEVGLAVRTNKSNTKAFVHHKMRFLSNWGLKMDELVVDCESRAFEALLNHYPVFESRKHFNNLYKLSIRQAGLKIIAHYTTDGRNVFDKEGEYRKSAMEVEGQDGSMVDGHDQGWDLPSSGLTGHSPADDEAVLQVRSLLDSGQLDKLDRSFVALLAGETTPAFEQWLMRAHSIQDVDRVVASCTPRYRRLVMEFTQFPIAKLRRIQDMLTGARQRDSGVRYLDEFAAPELPKLARNLQLSDIDMLLNDYEMPELPKVLRKINSQFFIGQTPEFEMPTLPKVRRR